MRAIEIIDPGPNACLLVTEREVPVPKDNEVLIKTHAAGLNRPDLLQRAGKYPPPKGASDIPGLEIAGEIEQGDTAGNFKKGDKVMALLAGGGYAEYAAVPAGQVLPIPKGFSMIEAAALPETCFTVRTNLFDGGKLKRGESVLIHGGSSGIGTIAIQIAKLYDCTVFTTAGNDEKCEACKKLGADYAINYKREDFSAIIKDLGGVDLVLDMVGGDYYRKNIALLKPFGRHVSIASLNGGVGEVDILHVMRNRLTLTGSTLRARSSQEKAAIAEAVYENLWPAFESGKIRPVIDRVFDFKDAEEAQRYMQSGVHIGKIVLNLV